MLYDSTVHEAPVFYGHYWESGTPTTTSDRTVCLDYSVAKGGPLVAYRCDKDEPTLTDKCFRQTTVSRHTDT